MKWKALAFFLVISVFVLPLKAQQYLVDIETIMLENPDSCIRALSQDSTTRQKFGTTESLYLLAFCYHNTGSYDLSIEQVNKLIHSYPPDYDSSLFFKALLLNAENFRIMEDYDLSLPLLLNTLRYHQSIWDSMGVIRDHLRLLEFYRAKDDLDAAKHEAQKAFDLIDHYGMQTNSIRASLLNRTAAILVQEGIEIDSAIRMSKQVLLDARVIEDKSLRASSANELGFIYMNIGNDSALFFLRVAENLYRELKFERYLINVELNIARYYLEIKDYDLSRKTIETVIQKSLQRGWVSIKKDAYLLKSKILYAQGNYKEAYDLNTASNSMNVKILENQYSDKLIHIQSRYKLEEAERLVLEKQLQVEELNNRTKVEELEKERLYIALTAVLSILVVLTYFYFRNAARSKELRESRTTLQKTNEVLEKLITQKETLLQEIHHRVKNNLSVLSSLLYLQKKNLKSEEAIEALSNSQNRISTIALIHEGMYQRNDMSEVAFQDYLEKLVLSIKDSFGPSTEHVRIVIECHDLTLSLDKSIPIAMIINELVTNSFKYALEDNPNPVIGIEYQTKENRIKVYDNGGGEVKKKGSSLGMRLIKIFASQIDCKIKTRKEGIHLVTYIKF